MRRRRSARPGDVDLHGRAVHCRWCCPPWQRWRRQAGAVGAGADPSGGRPSIGLQDLARRLAVARAWRSIRSTARRTRWPASPSRTAAMWRRSRSTRARASTRIESYVAVDDLGHIVSPQLVEGQVHGGVIQGAGQAFGEEAVYDEESGQLLSGSFTDYTMPRAGLVPVFRQRIASGADVAQRARRQGRRRIRLFGVVAGAGQRDGRCAARPLRPDRHALHAGSRLGRTAVGGEGFAGVTSGAQTPPDPFVSRDSVLRRLR